jgi:hypothetical protein
MSMVSSRPLVALVVRCAPLVAGCALVVAGACSRGKPAASPATAGPPQAAGVPATTGNACDRKLLTAADVAGILDGPITGSESLPGDPQSCVFNAPNSTSITVSLRPGLGRTTVQTWNAGRMPVSATPLAGVGDEAAWVDPLHEVVAEKNDLLCDIQVNGLSAELRAASAATRQARIGSLCNRIFAAAQ